MESLKEILIFYNWRQIDAEDLAQDLTERVAEFQIQSFFSISQSHNQKYKE